MKIVRTFDVVPNSENERVIAWDEFTDKDKRTIIFAHFKNSNIKYNPETMFRVWNLAKPNIILGSNEEQKAYCRVAGESLEVLKLLTVQYC